MLQHGSPRTARTPRVTTARSVRPTSSTPGSTWQRRLTDAGWAGIHWPIEHGGRGLTPEHNGVWLLECARAGVPAVFNMVGFVLAGGAIMRYGTPEQQAQHLRATLADRARVVPAVLRTGRRQRPRLAVDARRTRRRPLHRQRPEGLVLRRAVLQLGHPDGAHAPARSDRRTRRTEARGDLVLPVPDGSARHRDPTAEADDGRGRVRRGVLHRRATCPPTTSSGRCTAAGVSAWRCSPASAATSAPR